MLHKISRLFVIKNRFEASAIIYALALGSAERGQIYLSQYPGFGGKLLFLASCLAVFMAGAKIMDAMKYEREARAQALPVKADTEM
ncbi:hypothetical protein [Novosphingobium sp.]|uniref:hypothetical protein n=1 Tax=Novosphingobium sp. TaxID=1874826 RepID=UPI00262BBA0F|nr:hypothetical protein [Novosphingobium sp.]